MWAAHDSFREVDVTLEPLDEHDLMFEVRAVSVNPLDIKLRSSFDARDAPKVLG